MIKIINFEKLDSTNTYAKANLDSLEDRTVVSAKMQTNGHGRFNRSWIDIGDENIYMTIVLKPSCSFSETYSNLTQYLSVVLCKQLEEIGLQPKIKWPNDVLLSEKKVCGILAEAVFKGMDMKGIMLGIGVNLNAKKNVFEKIDRPATAVNIEAKANINKALFMENLLNEFFKGYDDFLQQGFESIKEDYIKRASFLNKELNVSIFNRIESGYAKGLNNKGELILAASDGSEHLVTMGEIRN